MTDASPLGIRFWHAGLHQYSAGQHAGLACQSSLHTDELMQPVTLFDNLATAVICLDSKLAITALNPAAEVLFGIRARHAMGTDVTQIIPVLSNQSARLRQALTAGISYTLRELRLFDPRRGEVTVDCSITPWTDDGHPALLLECLPMDRHLRISREDRLQTQNMANREMLHGLAHEIKNPLGGLRGAAQLLQRAAAEADLSAYTEVIIRESDRLQKLVDQMLGPHGPPQFSDQNVHRILEHVRRLVAAQLPESVDLIRDYDPSLPELEADDELLIQVFFNLLNNASYAVGEQGSITLRTRSQRLFTIGAVQHRLVLRIDVIDDGCGIDEALLPRIFVPLVTARAQGTGMGLPIAQSLVHRHGGLIECDSRPGRTEFRVYLPLRACHA